MYSDTYSKYLFFSLYLIILLTNLMFFYKKILSLIRTIPVLSAIRAFLNFEACLIVGFWFVTFNLYIYNEFYLFKFCYSSLLSLLEQ